MSATPKNLRLAITKNSASKVESLLSQGVTVDAEVLLLAVSRGHAAILGLLLEAGPAPMPEEAPRLLIAAVQADGAATLPHLLRVFPVAALDGTVREWTPLMHAVKLGQLAAVDALLQAGASAEYRMPTAGGTALMIGVQHSQPMAVARLLEARAPLETQDTSGWTALKWAAQMGDAAVVRVLLEAGATVETAEGEGSALMVAAENLRAEAVEELVARGSPLEACDEQGWTATAIAAGSGHVRILRALLGAGASVLSRTRATRRTALMAAAQGGHTPAVLLLLKHAPALPSAAGGEAAAAAAAAAAGGGAAVAHINERDAQGHTALMLAAKNAHAQACTALLEHGADVDATDAQGHTALEFASRRGALGAARALLEASPPPSSLGVARALPTALKAGHVDLVKLLGAHGAPLQPHLMRAACLGDSELLHALLQAGAATDVDLASEAMLGACCAGHRGVVAQLLGAGASVFKQDRLNGRSALLLAAQYGHAPVARLLLAAAAPCNAADASGARPLLLAVRGGHAAVADELLRHGAKLVGGPGMTEASGEAAHEALLREATDSSVRGLLLAEVRRRALEAELCSHEAAAATKRSKKQRRRDAQREARREEEEEEEEGGGGEKEADEDESGGEGEGAATPEAATPEAAEEAALQPAAPEKRADAAAGSGPAARSASAVHTPPRVSAAMANSHSPLPPKSAATEGDEGEGEGEEWEAEETDTARDLETFGGPGGGPTGFMPPADLVAAGGRVRAQELDMAGLARQSLGFADATQQVDVVALQQQIRQLQMR
jgi:ankyrin repeat protein